MNNYVTPNAALGNKALQDALDRAKASGLDKVVVPAGEWTVDEPILLPSYIHVVLDGAVIIADKVAFRNENLYSTFGCMKEGRQRNIVISGENGAKIKGGIVIHNAENVTVENITFEGEGVTLSFCHDARVRNVASDVTALYLMNGCHQLSAKGIKGETALKVISRRAAVGDFMSWNYDYNFDVFEESPEICFGVFENVSGKVTVFAEGEAYNIAGEAEVTAENKEFFNVFNLVITR